MKILVRIMIIMAVFSAVSGLIIAAVNYSGMNAPDFGGGAGRREIRPGAGEGGSPEGGRFRPERGGLDLRWLIDLARNLAVIAILVVLIVWPKSISRNRKRSAQAVLPPGR